MKTNLEPFVAPKPIDASYRGECRAILSVN